MRTHAPLLNPSAFALHSLYSLQRSGRGGSASKATTLCFILAIEVYAAVY